MTLMNSRMCIALAFVVATGLAACDRTAKSQVRTALAPDASTQVIGVKPADPTGDPPGTTPVAGKAGTTTVSKQEETTQKPQEGDNHSYSSVAPDNPQKGDTGKDAQQSPERTRQ